MNHFKLVYEGILPPAGEVYGYTEAANGELGYYIVSDGAQVPLAGQGAPALLQHLPGLPADDQGQAAGRRGGHHRRPERHRRRAGPVTPMPKCTIDGQGDRGRGGDHGDPGGARSWGSTSPTSAGTPTCPWTATAACAWSRSRRCRSCRSPATPRSATAWWCRRRAPRRPRPTARRWSSCWSTTPSTARSATRPASATCRTSTWSTASTTPRSSSRRRSRSARWWTWGRSCSTPSAACSARAACASSARSPAPTASSSANRGDHTQIATFENRPITHDYAGNLADVCPVGALLSHDFRFKMRVWFLEEHRVGLPGLLHRLQHLHRPPRRRGAAPAAAPQRRGQQVLDVRPGPRALQGDRLATRRAPRARSVKRRVAWAPVALDAALDARGRAPAAGGHGRRLRGLAPGHQRGPVRLPRCSPSRPGACSTSASATRRTSSQVREDNVLLRADRNPNTQGCLDLGPGPHGRRRHPGRLPRRAR